MNNAEKIKLFQDVFAPKPEERVLFLIDIPHHHLTDTPLWKDRRAMARDWFMIFTELGTKTGFTVHLQQYPTTGISNT